MMKYSLFTKLFVTLILFMGMSCELVHARKRSVSEMNAIAVSVFSNEENVTRTMLNTGDNFVSPLSISVKSKEIEELKTIIGSEEVFYIYTFQDGRPGYVIVSTDDNLPEVLAFSDSDKLNIKDLPSSMVRLLFDYASTMTDVQQSEDVQSNDTSSSVEPLLGNIAFAQRAPYNGKCPTYNGENTLTGCIATAMSQIMAYYQYPKRMKGDYISYTTENLLIPVEWDCSSTYFDWKNMLDTYSQEVSEYTENEDTTAKEYMVLTGIQRSEAYKNYLEIYNFANNFSTPLYATVQLLLTDESGKFMRPIGTPNYLDGLKSRHFYNTYYFKHSLPTDLPDGQYRLYVGVKLDSTSEWSIVKKAVDENDIYNSPRVDCYVTVIKSGLFYSVEGESYACGYSAEQADAVATLCAASGAAAEMDYTPNASSASMLEARNALIRYMGYDESIAYVDKSFFAPEKWLELMKNELKSGRPLYCGGQSETGIGHGFVIDGYRYLNEQLYFHVNWGWNGGSNGYFLIDYLRPSNSGEGVDDTNYGYSLSLLTGISPDNGKDDGMTIGAKGVTLSFPNEPTEMEISINRLTNCSFKEFSGNVMAYATNDECDIFLGNVYSYIGMGWKPNFYVNTITKTLSIPPFTPSGTYTLELRAQEVDSDVENSVFIPNILTFSYNNISAEAIFSPTLPADNGSPEIYDLTGKRVYNIEYGNIYIINGKKVYVE